jgi:hypothetical protein
VFKPAMPWPVSDSGESSGQKFRTACRTEIVGLFEHCGRGDPRHVP